MVKTYKQKFNEKHNQPIDTSNSLKKISQLSKIKLSNIKKIYKKGIELMLQIPKVFALLLQVRSSGPMREFIVQSWEVRQQRLIRTC